MIIYFENMISSNHRYYFLSRNLLPQCLEFLKKKKNRKIFKQKLNIQEILVSDYIYPFSIMVLLQTGSLFSS